MTTPKENVNAARHPITTLQAVGTIALAVLSSVAIATHVHAELKSTLTIEIDGLKTQKGDVCLKLFSSSFDFPDNDKNAVVRRCVKITEPSPKITLKDLPSGSYALVVFQDLNGDRILNRNTKGIPTEGYGFSNNPDTRQDLSRYGDCVFLLAGATETITVKMRYTLEK